MTLRDNHLRQIVQTLPPHERLALELHLDGIRTPQSRAIVRRIKSQLKRRVRSKRR